jgi:RNA polymerase sigma factor (TIGR02999 family)
MANEGESRATPAVNDVTGILSAIEQGDRQAAGALLPLVYDELRKLAAQKLAQEKPGQTLDATALVHEAYLHLVGDQGFANRPHFFAAAAEAMRRILIDRARARNSRKRGGVGRCRVALDGVAAPDPDDRLLALDEALTQLASSDPLAARVVEMHHFAGMSHEQVAAALSMSVYQARQKWTFARAWLKTTLGEF